jgi:NAD(P)-dependent dehydrogenase (short-subunit alcohol dehydrogenase family)
MSLDPFLLNGKNILITGASSGIGRATAIQCAEMGARVILLGRDHDRLENTLSGMANASEHLIYSVDLTDYDAVHEIVKDSVQKVGRISGVVHSAGISTTLPIKLLTPEKLDKFFRTNVHGAINLTKLVTRLAVMAEGGGSIVFISSVMGAVGEAGKTLYSLTKGALHAGAKSLAIELASRKIRVNCIAPGVVESPMSNNAVYSQDEQLLEKIRSLHPLGFGKAEDVAYASVYLLSDAARWITGTTLFIDGGYTAR